MSGAVRRGPGLAGGGHMVSGGHNPGRQARDDQDVPAPALTLDPDSGQ